MRIKPKLINEISELRMHEPKDNQLLDIQKYSIHTPLTLDPTSHALENTFHISLTSEN